MHRRCTVETTAVEFLSKKIIKKLLNIVNLIQEMTFFKVKISKFSQLIIFAKLWSILFLNVKFLLKNFAVENDLRRRRRL